MPTWGEQTEQGFINHKGHFLTRRLAMEYAQQNDLLNAQAQRFVQQRPQDARLELGASFLSRDAGIKPTTFTPIEGP